MESNYIALLGFVFISGIVVTVTSFHGIPMLIKACIDSELLKTCCKKIFYKKIKQTDNNCNQMDSTDNIKITQNSEILSMEEKC